MNFFIEIDDTANDLLASYSLLLKFILADSLWLVN